MKTLKSILFLALLSTPLLGFAAENTFNGGGFLPVGPLPVFTFPNGVWYGLSSSNCLFQVVSNTEISIFISGVPPLASNVYGSGMLNEVQITDLSFNWSFTSANVSIPSNIIADYYLGGSAYNLVTGGTVFSSGSVSLSNLALPSIGFGLSVSSGSGTLNISNIEYSVIPESSSYALIYSLVVLAYMLLRINPLSRTKRYSE